MPLIVVFVGIIFALALLPSIANDSAKVSTKQTFINDSTTYAAAVAPAGQINESYQMNLTKHWDATDWRATDCPITSYTFTNSNGTAYTEDTDYVFTAAYGNFTLIDTYKVNWTVGQDNLTLVNYTYCDPGYSTEGSARASISIIPTLLILVLIIFAAAAVAKKFE